MNSTTNPQNRRDTKTIDGTQVLGDVANNGTATHAGTCDVVVGRTYATFDSEGRLVTQSQAPYGKPFFGFGDKEVVVGIMYSPDGPEAIHAEAKMTRDELGLFVSYMRLESPRRFERGADICITPDRRTPGLYVMELGRPGVGTNCGNMHFRMDSDALALMEAIAKGAAEAVAYRG